jgi:radical SAM protein with 4Fe4S-binding SPASM domain
MKNLPDTHRSNSLHGVPFDGLYSGKDFAVVPLDGGGHALFFVEGGRIYTVPQGTATRLAFGPEALLSAERKEWDSLCSGDDTESYASRAVSRIDPRDGAYLALNVNLTSRCNLDCIYCFAGGGDYGRLEGDMPTALAGRIATFADRHRNNVHKVRFEHFGGEPLLNLSCMEAVCFEGERLRLERDIEIIHRVSTNLTVLPERAVALFARHDFIVSISIDGNRRTHNRNRPGGNSREWFDDILDNVRRLRKARPNLRIVARMTVNDTETPLVENVRSLWRENLFDYFQILPAVSQAHPFGIASGVTEEFVSLLEAYPSFFNPENRFRGILEVERYVDMILGGKIAPAHCSAGRNYFTISLDGTVSPCHRLVGDTIQTVGTIDSVVLENLGAWEHTAHDSPACTDCWVRFLCGGGCRQNHLVLMGDLDTPHHALCKLETILVGGAIRMVVEGGSVYSNLDRSPLEDMFVSCGRPVIAAPFAAKGHEGPIFSPMLKN